MQADKLLKEIAELKHYHRMGLQKAETLEKMLLSEARTTQAKLPKQTIIAALAKRKKHLLK